MSSSNLFEALVYGSIATAVVSLLSLSGVIVLPLVTGDARQRWMQFFIAMAVSTLSSDALLHIIPSILGLHKHTNEDDHHEHDHEENTTANTTTGVVRTQRHAGHEHESGLSEERQRLLWLSLVLAAVYCIYFFEFAVFYRKRYVHHPEKVAHCPAHDEQRLGAEKSLDNNSSQTSDSDANEKEEEAVRCCGLTSRAIIILFGDGAHNFLDGIAMGTSFMAGWEQGLAATIAIVCHELPHELGDLAVLLDSGLPMCRALLLNLISAVTAFLGLYLAIAIGHADEGYQRVLMALTAGMFLYVAWIDMLSHLKHNGPANDHWLLVCLLQLAGFLLGFGLVFAVAWFEEDIENWRIN